MSDNRYYVKYDQEIAGWPVLQAYYQILPSRFRSSPLGAAQQKSANNSLDGRVRQPK